MSSIHEKQNKDEKEALRENCHHIKLRPDGVIIIKCHTYFVADIIFKETAALNRAFLVSFIAAV